MIVAAGRGSRMGPITDSVPKGMIAIGGMPLIEHTVRSLRMAGITSFVVGIGWRGNQIQNYLSSMFPELNIDFAEVDYSQGGPLQTLVAALKYTGNEPFLLTPADYVVDPVVISQLVAELQKTDHTAMASVATIQERPRGSKIYLGAEGNIVGIERIVKSTSKTVSSGMMLLASDEAKAWFLNAASDGETSVAETINQMIEQDQRIASVPVSGELYDIDEPRNLLDAMEYILQTARIRRDDSIYVPAGDVIDVNDNMLMDSGLSLGEGTRLIGPTYISSFTSIGAECIIGPMVSVERRSVVESGLSLRRVLLLEDSKAERNHENVVISGSNIVGEN
ncbi:MAG: NTP transferase domain-containing protein [Candidatus Hodarchaeota archaeon]